MPRSERWHSSGRLTVRRLGRKRRERTPSPSDDAAVEAAKKLVEEDALDKAKRPPLRRYGGAGGGEKCSDERCEAKIRSSSNLHTTRRRWNRAGGRSSPRLRNYVKTDAAADVRRHRSRRRLNVFDWKKRVGRNKPRLARRSPRVRRNWRRR